jgi:hypothetical protein
MDIALRAVISTAWSSIQEVWNDYKAFCRILGYLLLCVMLAKGYYYTGQMEKNITSSGLLIKAA